ncbi:hypothetical protein C8J57DRAFT_1259099 [Mycena rebaudengoi]|nr:hypothetical protein C8J57DRAFT_1259099 [Mycena rebaudengoi]
MSPATSKPRVGLLSEFQVAQRKQKERNEKVRIRMAVRRVELKNSCLEVQALYAERTRMAQAKYRENQYGAVYGTRQMNVWAIKLARRREVHEEKAARRERRLCHEARQAEKTAARPLRCGTPSQESDNDTDQESDEDRDSFDNAASPAGSE